jgi:hypothetical protein
VNAQSVISAAFLTVSMIALTVQAWALLHMRRYAADGWLTRTAGCRVTCAVLYVCVGVNAIWIQWVTLQFSLLVYLGTQTIWGVNSAIDTRLARRRMEKA